MADRALHQAARAARAVTGRAVGDAAITVIVAAGLAKVEFVLGNEVIAVVAPRAGPLVQSDMGAARVVSDEDAVDQTESIG